MRNLSFKHSKQQLVENFLNYEFNLSKNKKSEKVIYVIDLLAYNYTNEQFIIKLYRDILEREPNPEEYNYYVNLLKTNKEIRESILYAFITSPEAKKINIDIKGLANLTHPNLFFKVNLFLKKLFYSLIYH